MKRIGILLGSFDPPHIGHINMATQALNKELVDHVVFVPTKQNPWKENSTDWTTRCDMVISSIKDIFKCSISFVESYLQEPYYTSNTLRALQKVYSDCELYLIVGADTSLNIIYWHEGEWILNNFKFITVSRSNYITDCDIEQTIDVSSTMIRELAQQEKILFPLVTKDVEQLIKLNKLYK